MASEELTECRTQFSFDAMEDAGLDMLCAFEPGKLVLIGGLTQLEREEDEEETDAPGAATEPTSASTSP